MAVVDQDVVSHEVVSTLHRQVIGLLLADIFDADNFVPEYVAFRVSPQCIAVEVIGQPGNSLPAEPVFRPCAGRIKLSLRDAGFEVIYTGLRQSVEAIVSVATQEAVDVIGLSILSGSHLPICTKMQGRLKQAGLEDKIWIVGGNIPHGDRGTLEGLGVDRVFPTGTPFAEIVGYLEERLS